MSPGFIRRLRGPLIGAAATALVFVTASALAGSGINGVFNLGVSNTVDAQTQLSGTVDGNAQLRVENASVAGSSFGLLGRMTSQSPAANSAGLRGVNSATNGSGFGVQGIHNGSGAGVFGQTALGTGVLGKRTSTLQTSGPGAGVEGDNASSGPLAFGVLGRATNASFVDHDSAGVRGESGGFGAGVSGESTFGPAGLFDSTNSNGVEATSHDVTGSGVVGNALGTGDGVIGGSTQGRGGAFFGLTTGVFGSTNGSGSTGVFGASIASNGFGVQGTSNGTGGQFRGDKFGATGEATETDGVGLEGTANVGPNAIGVHGTSTSGVAGRFDGSVRIQGSLSVSGNIAKNYSPSSGSFAVPVAFGVIRSNGTTAGVTANVTSTFDSANTRYLVDIGQSYSTTAFVTVVTPLSSQRIASTTASSGKLVVRFVDAGNSAAQSAFSFVTYQP